MSIEEAGIARTQEKLSKSRLAERDGLRSYHSWNIAYIDERIYVYLLAMALLALLGLWTTARSAWLLYGSLALVMVLTVFWGLARIGRIERTRRERARQVREAEAGRRSPQRVEGRP